MIIILAIVFVFSGCKVKLDFDDEDSLTFSNVTNETKNDRNNGFITESSSVSIDNRIEEKQESEEIRGAWFSYMELNPQKISNQADYEKYLDEIFSNLKSLKINSLFVQVRAFCDSIYPSDIFESSSSIVEKRADKLPFDFFDVIIKKSNEYGMRVHAWINPYRVSVPTKDEIINSESRLGRLIAEGNDDVVEIDTGLFLNPASVKAQELVIDGVREIFEKYDVDGIHLDDYFYPTTEESFDEKFYTAYHETGGALSLDDWRRENVNTLISGIYSAAKTFSQNKIVSISPAGDIDKNYSVHYADVEKWCNEEGYADLIMPQIYFGFENQTMPFESVALRWKNLCRKDTTRICIGLALYKAGNNDAFAGTGSDEWIENDDIISRQVSFLRENDFDGFSLFSTQYVNFNKNNVKNELKNLKDMV